MEIQENKDIVRRLCDALTAGDIAGCLALASDDRTCCTWVKGKDTRLRMNRFLSELGRPLHLG